MPVLSMHMCSSNHEKPAITAIEHSYQPDSKTRRYDRQLRLWASSGQAALESSRVRILSSTSILKNLVLPGINHYTILDPGVQPEDAGINFFLEGYKSVGEFKASEAVRLLRVLNDNVDGQSSISDVSRIITENPPFLTSFTLIIAHILDQKILDNLIALLWSDPSGLSLIVFHEHPIIDTHTEKASLLRINQPFPALLKHATKLDFDAMHPTDHGCIPFVVILIRALALEDWKSSHAGIPPLNRADEELCKKQILGMSKKLNKQNFVEASSQVYQAWTKSSISAEVATLLEDNILNQLQPDSPPFYQLLDCLRCFIRQPPCTLPLTSTSPDMKSDTANNNHLQKIYKAQAEKGKAEFKAILQEKGYDVDLRLADEILKNSHGVKLLLPNPPSFVTASLNAPLVIDNNQRNNFSLLPLSDGLQKKLDISFCTTIAGNATHTNNENVPEQSQFTQSLEAEFMSKTANNFDEWFSFHASKLLQQMGIKEIVPTTETKFEESFAVFELELREWVLMTQKQLTPDDKT